MNLPLDDVIHMASLARLELTEVESKTYPTELRSILDYVETLETYSKSATTTRPAENIFRDDLTTDSLPRNDALKNAPLVKDGYIQVQAVLSSDDN